MDLSKFQIIAVISNPYRYNSRYNLYKKFQEDALKKIQEECVNAGAQLWTLELSQGARLSKVTDKGNPQHFQLWTSSLPGDLWLKENMINSAIAHMTRINPDWRYVAWIDADVKFEHGFLSETQQALQHWDIVQMWSHAIDLDSAENWGASYEAVSNPQTHLSYMYCHWKGINVKSKSGYTEGGHPGFAWAARREALNKLGGLIDIAVLGSADRHMAGALLGDVQKTYHGDVHPNYKKALRLWQERAEKNIRRNVGFTGGLIRHMWHGRKSDRGYSSRWQILVRNQYNPETDLKRDVSGIYQLVSETPRQMRLRDDIRKYFIARNEDHIA